MRPETKPGQVLTVLGPIEAAALGVVDAHSHLHIAPLGVPGAPVLDDEAGAGRELAAFRAAGGGAIVDCQPGGCGRDGRVLRRLSARTGIHVIAATGFHRRIYYPPDAPQLAMDAQAAADYLRDEIAAGLAETRDEPDGPVYPGVIKIAAEATLDASPLAVLEAAAQVCRETGYAIEIHTEAGAAVEDILPYFTAQGVAPERLIFCHVDKRPDRGLHRALAQAGVMLEYDTFFRPKYRPEQNVWPLIEAMAAAGLAGNVALATDMALPDMWAELGGEPGLLGIFTLIRAGLERLALPPDCIDGLLGGHIGRRLAIEGFE